MTVADRLRSARSSRRPPVRLWLAAALLLAAGAWLLLRPPARPARGDVARCLHDIAGRAPNIVLITMDTTRADHLPAYGYGGGRTPNLDRLAARGTLFEQCVTSSPFTLPAH